MTQDEVKRQLEDQFLNLMQRSKRELAHIVIVLNAALERALAEEKRNGTATDRG